MSEQEEIDEVSSNGPISLCSDNDDDMKSLPRSPSLSHVEILEADSPLDQIPDSKKRFLFTDDVFQALNTSIKLK